MYPQPETIPGESETITHIRLLSEQAFSRAAGAPLLSGNHVRLLKDADENYPAWLAAIGKAQHYIHFENYLIADDCVGQLFTRALIDKARQGIPVRLVYDWFGCLGRTPARFWNHLRDNGIDVRCYNPPHPERLVGWFSRDHRKMLCVDGTFAGVMGLCIARQWTGIPEKNIQPWRDTGVEVRGSAVADIDRAFAQVWAMTGAPLPPRECVVRSALDAAGDLDVRIVADAPATAGMFRLDQLIAALARSRLWLTDAYFAGTAPYVQALRAVARDGVDVRLLVPNATNLPLIKPLSRTGYRLLLEAGVRIFEWNGSMLHAKCAVADSLWARVGSTNLNIASWFGNCELDVVVENGPFAAQMEQMYLEDLDNATEITLDTRHRIRHRAGQALPRENAPALHRSGRVTAGIVRIGHAIGSAFSGKRVLNWIEARMVTISGVLLLCLAVLFAYYPLVVLVPVIGFSALSGLALVYQGIVLHLQKRRGEKDDLP